MKERGELPRINLDLDVLDREARKRRGLDDFLYWCQFFCGYEDVKREEQGELLGAWEAIFGEVRARAKRRRSRKGMLGEDNLTLRLADCMPRGTYKTSINMAAALRIIVEWPSISIRWNMNTVENAEEKVQAMGDRLRWGRIPDHFGAFYNAGHWSRNSLKVAGSRSDDPTISAGGLDERQTSTHCDILFMSDVQDDKNSQTHERRKKTEQWRSSALNLLKQKTLWRLEVWDSTRWHRDDIAGQIRALWESEKRPRHLWSVYRPVRDRRTGALNFPSLFNDYKLAELRDPAVSGLREYEYFTQYELDTSRSEHTKFKAEWLVAPAGYDPNAGERDSGRTTQCLAPQRLNFFVTIDPADPDKIQAARERGDYDSMRDKCDTGMLLSAMDERKNRLFFESVTAQMTIQEMGEQIVRWFRAYHMPDRNRDPKDWPVFGKQRAARQWTFRLVGVEKAVFSGILVRPLRTYLGDQPALGKDWAARLLSDHRSPIQVSNTKSKAARQDATEVDWATGRARIAQQQFDLNAAGEHPASVLMEAKREYPAVSKWDVLDAESLCWGPGFMSAPQQAANPDDVYRAQLRRELDDEIARLTMDPEYVDRVVREEAAQLHRGHARTYGPREYLGAPV